MWGQITRNLGQKISKFHYYRGITPKRTTSGGAHLRDLAFGQQETLQWWRVVGDRVRFDQPRDSNPRPPAPIATFSTSTPTG